MGKLSILRFTTRRLVIASVSVLLVSLIVAWNLFQRRAHTPGSAVLNFFVAAPFAYSDPPIVSVTGMTPDEVRVIRANPVLRNVDVCITASGLIHLRPRSAGIDASRGFELMFLSQKLASPNQAIIVVRKMFRPGRGGLEMVFETNRVLGVWRITRAEKTYDY